MDRGYLQCKYIFADTIEENEKKIVWLSIVKNILFKIFDISLSFLNPFFNFLWMKIKLRFFIFFLFYFHYFSLILHHWEINHFSDSPSLRNKFKLKMQVKITDSVYTYLMIRHSIIQLLIRCSYEASF